MTIRVLVVDDSATIRQALSAQLKEREIECDTARNGNEALDKLAPGHGFDVIITDLKMPGMVDGERLIDTLKRDAALSTLPIIVVTAFSDRDSQLHHLEQGVAAFFGKPWDPDVLAITVRNNARQKSRADLLTSDSRTDALTGLGNRRYGVQRLQEEMDACRRSRRLLSVVLLDIDHFKHVNDTYGHPGGDDVLRHVGLQLRSVSRSSDVVARWGGEEFLFVFPETDLSQATQIVDRFRSHLASQSVAMPSSSGQITVTISGGAAELEPHDTPDTLMARADEALYKAKQTGRNRLMASQSGKLFPVQAA